MKLQFGDGRLRIRVRHAELESLLSGQPLETGLAWPTAPWHLVVRLGETLAVDAGSATVGLTLPREEVRALASRLPSREGLGYALELASAPLELRFEVDVHDGRRTRR